jgi:hypothetical protein
MKSDHLAGSRTAEDADVEKTQVVQIRDCLEQREDLVSFAFPAFLRDAMVRSDPEKSDEVRGKSRDEIS